MGDAVSGIRLPVYSRVARVPWRKKNPPSIERKRSRIPEIYATSMFLAYPPPLSDLFFRFIKRRNDYAGRSATARETFSRVFLLSTIAALLGENKFLRVLVFDIKMDVENDFSIRDISYEHVALTSDKSTLLLV